MVGAMTGAAIGGVAGLMLANKKTRENLALVKDKAIESAGDILNNVTVETRGMQDKAEEITDTAQRKITKSLPKNNK
jgi:gas vesicle protein